MKLQARAKFYEYTGVLVLNLQSTYKEAIQLVYP